MYQEQFIKIRNHQYDKHKNTVLINQELIFFPRNLSTFAISRYAIKDKLKNKPLSLKISPQNTNHLI